MKHSLIAGAVFAATAVLAQAALAQNPVSSAIGPPIPRAEPPVNRGFGSTLPNQAAGTAAMTPGTATAPNCAIAGIPPSGSPGTLPSSTSPCVAAPRLNGGFPG